MSSSILRFTLHWFKRIVYKKIEVLDKGLTDQQTLKRATRTNSALKTRGRPLEANS